MFTFYVTHCGLSLTVGEERQWHLAAGRGINPKPQIVDFFLASIGLSKIS